MEGDDLSSSKAKLGLQKGLSQNSSKPRVKRMEGEEKKSGSKKRLKLPPPVVQVGLVSDDDEPIGSLFKMKKPRNPKKVKLVDSLAKEEKKLVVEDNDSAGMDDTLASFRKKLKGPKKDVGSLCARLSARTKINVKEDTTCGDSVMAFGDGDLDQGLASQGASLVDLRDGSQSLDDNSKHSLSATGKTQSGLTRKPHPNSGLKPVSGIQTLEDKPAATSASNVMCCDSKTEEVSNALTGLSSLDLAARESNTREDQRLGNGFCEASGCKEENSDTIKMESTLDPCSSHKVCDENCSASGEKERSETQVLKNGLKHGAVGKVNSAGDNTVGIRSSYSAQMEIGGIHRFGESSSYKDCSDAMDSLAGDVLTVCQTDVKCPSLFSLSSKEDTPVASDDDELANKMHESTAAEAEKQYCERTSDSETHNLKVNEAARTYGNCDVVNSQNERPDLASVSQKDNVCYAVTQNCSSVLHQNQHSDDATEGTCAPSQSYFSINREATETFACVIAPEEIESHPDDTVSVPDSEIKDGKLSAVQRAVRKTKKRRLGDMAYEGDADWESLINEQRFLDNDIVVDGDMSFRMREKSDSSSLSLAEGENGVAAAVSAGLKARAVGPVEKIKFKEVLKHKGGLQEYLECRNHILGLWSKDVGRILPLAECGVPEVPSKDETAHASLIREVYVFLDQSGYINVGVASEKEKSEASAKHNYKLSNERKFEGNLEGSAADLEDGVTFILGQVKSSETSLEAKNEVMLDDEDPASNVTNRRDFVTSITLEMEDEKCPGGDSQQTGALDRKLPNGMVNVDDSNADPSSAVLDGQALVITPELQNDLKSAPSSSDDHMTGTLGVHCDSEDRKNIIVIGAGPAGLTAARHLQRQGFSVTVIEARSRIGGRVHTDRSSLSVPVDLGASIITGVEADVATERRPDPSSLICAQLGLELTILNSDCPLYDVVTGEKVPAELDEALEAEFNSLLDDMLLLVAQKGEHALKMSLEDGLEYALKRRRKAQSLIDLDETELQKEFDSVNDSQTCIVDGGVAMRRSDEEILSPIERRVMDWHFANLEYGCAALLKEVSLPNWNQDDVYGGFGGAHCMIKGGYSNVVESLGKGLLIHLNHVVTDISYGTGEAGSSESQCSKVKVFTSNGGVFSANAVLITVPLGCLKAETIKFVPPLPQWKQSAIQRLGFGVLNKVVLEFPEVFWDDSVDYFGATAEDTDRRGHCFMFWNVRKTVGAPVLIALVVGKAAVDSHSKTSSDHVTHALMVLRRLFGEASVPDPVASVVTDWGRDPFSYGAYSYVAIGSSGEDYDILGRPVDSCLFFAGEATCKEHPDTVGGAMMSGLREAVRIIDILSTGNDHTAEAAAMEALLKHAECESDEVRDITTRLEAVELSSALYKNSLDRARILTREALLQDMFFNAKTTPGRLYLAKELLKLPLETLKSFAGTRKGLTMLNSWMLDSMGKDGTQLLRHCVRILVRVSTDLLAVRLSGIGKTVKEKVCMHTSRDIRAIASQLVNVWLEVFRREKAANGGLKLSRQAIVVDPSKRKSLNNLAAGKPPLRTHHGALENKGTSQVPAFSGGPLDGHANLKKVNVKAQSSLGRQPAAVEVENNLAMSDEERAALAAAEAASAAAQAAAEAYASSEAKCSSLLQLPKIPSFHKFARREQYEQIDEYDYRRKWPGDVLGRQDCLAEIDSRNCRVRDWSVDFSAACVNLDSSRMSVDNLSQRSHSNEIASHMNFREQSGESAAVDSSLFTKAWVETAGSVGIKDYRAIEMWQSQAAAAGSDFSHPSMDIKDEEDSNTSSKPRTWKNDGRANESSISQVTINKEIQRHHHRGADRIKQAVVDFVASLLMPVYKARKIDRDGYKSIMKKTATKVMEQATDAEKAMAVSQFLDFKRKNKIRDFVDKLIERHMAKPTAKT